MIRKNFQLTLTFVLLCVTFPLCSIEINTDECVVKTNTIELRGGAFYHVSKRFRDTYGTVASTIQFETSALVWAPFEVWTNLDWSTKRFKRDEFYKTRATTFNASIGIKYIYSFSKKLDLYIGIGPALAHTRLDHHFCCDPAVIDVSPSDSSCCYHNRRSKIVLGGVIKTGLRYYILTNVFLDLFMDYLYQPTYFHHYEDIGGLKSGAGLGVSF